MEETPEKITEEKAMMDQLARLMEARLQVGYVSEWSQRDFQRLSEDIQATTREQISVTTLKRVLGRVEYKGLPYVHTLNVLSQYVGFASWGQFKRSMAAAIPAEVKAEAVAPPPTSVADSPSADSTPVNTSAANPQWAAPPIDKVDAAPEVVPGVASDAYRWVLIALAVACVAALAWLFYTKDRPNTPAIATDSLALAPPALLAAVPVTKPDSVPLRMRFTYKGPRVGAERLNVITFEPGQMTYLNSDTAGTSQHEHTYTQPGLFLAKVFSNTHVLAATPVLVPNKHWQVLLRDKKRELLLRTDLADGKPLHFTYKDVLASGVDTSRFGGLQYVKYQRFAATGEDLSLSFTLKSDAALTYRQGSAISIKVRGEQEDFQIPLAQANGGDRPLFVRVSDKIVQGPASQNGTAGLLVDLNQLRRINISSSHAVLTVRIDGIKAFEHTYQKPVGQILGLEIGAYPGITISGLEVDRVEN